MRKQKRHKIIIKAVSKKGGAIIFCTHDLELVAEIGERFILINKGEIHINSTMSELMREHQLLNGRL